MMQYSSLYSLSKHLNYRLSIPAIQGFSNTNKQSFDGKMYDTPGNVYTLKVRHFLDFNRIEPNIKRTIVLGEESYFENIFNFHHHRSTLLKFFNLPPYQLKDYTFYTGKTSEPRMVEVDKIASKDLVISLRIGDFVYKPGADDHWKQCVYSRFLGFEYFELILKQIQFDRLFITSDEPLHCLVDKFEKYDPILVRNDDAIKTMAFINRFDRIAISESTYSWWAAYLTQASEIYFPISLTGLWAVRTKWDASATKWGSKNPMHERDKDLYLRVNDDRYKYVDQQSGMIYNYLDAPGRRDVSNFTCG